MIRFLSLACLVLLFRTFSIAKKEKSTEIMERLLSLSDTNKNSGSKNGSSGQKRKVSVVDLTLSDVNSEIEDVSSFELDPDQPGGSKMSKVDHSNGKSVEEITQELRNFVKELAPLEYDAVTSENVEYEQDSSGAKNLTDPGPGSVTNNSLIRIFHSTDIISEACRSIARNQIQEVIKQLLDHTKIHGLQLICLANQVNRDI